MSKVKTKKTKPSNAQYVINKLREFELALNLSSNLSKSELKKLRDAIQHTMANALQQA